MNCQMILEFQIDQRFSHSPLSYIQKFQNALPLVGCLENKSPQTCSEIQHLAFQTLYKAFIATYEVCKVLQSPFWIQLK